MKSSPAVFRHFPRGPETLFWEISRDVRDADFRPASLRLRPRLEFWRDRNNEANAVPDEPVGAAFPRLIATCRIRALIAATLAQRCTLRRCCVTRREGEGHRRC